MEQGKIRMIRCLEDRKQLAIINGWQLANKKMKKLFILLIWIAIPTILAAQPIVNNAEDFTIGTVLKFQNCSATGVSPGNSGANQTWNFASLTSLPDTITEWMVLPSSTTHGSLFPTANQVEKYSNGQFIYVNKTANENYIVGFIDTTTTYPATHYPNPMLFAKRPLNYGMVVTDTFTMAGSSALGIVTINPDAYGTLILPNGTHNNVLRVKITEVHPWFSYTVYIWFDGIITSALLKIDNQPDVEYLLDETTGIKEISEQKEFHFYPNPAYKQVTFQTQDKGELSITNNIGQVVMVTSIKQDQTILSTENLKPGIYYLTFQTKKYKKTSELIIQK
jgi:hypothetical protein